MGSITMNRYLSEPIKAPWTREQVDSLNEYQHASVMHPFTCGHCRHILTAAAAGWVCDECVRNGREYEQD
jgi:hypothetical protein